VGALGFEAEAGIGDLGGTDQIVQRYVVGLRKR
jgi:hypothetical protein